MFYEGDKHVIFGSSVYVSFFINALKYWATATFRRDLHKAK